MSVGVEAAMLDAGDPLASFRDEFVVAEPNLIYADGNSLGRLPKAAIELARDLVARQWGERLIRGWNDDWLDLPERMGAKIAGLIGADPDEVIVADSTTVNLFKLSVAALQARPGRTGIVSDDLNFPSDLHSLAQSAQLLGLGHELHVVESEDGLTVAAAAIADAVGTDTALVCLSHVVFKSGFRHDLHHLTESAHRRGALTLWDLSHSVGSVPIDVHAAEVDLAVGCTYKYLNGGPGAPAFLYVRRDLQEQLSNPLAGWMGRASMFDFDLSFEPAAGMRRFLTGTPAVLSLAMMGPGLDLVAAAGLDRLRQKSVALGEFFVDLWRSDLEPLGYRLRSPLDPEQRGSHISLGHDDGLAIDLALIEELSVIPDFRAPDNIRLGLAPLYTRFADVAELVSRLSQVVVEGRQKKYRDSYRRSNPRPIVT